MKRRTFIKNTGAAGAVIILTPAGIFKSCTKAFSSEDNGLLENLFVDPPDTARPYTWWHWMNGNITREGITRDLESMKEAGLGGFQLFEAGIGIPQGPVEYLSREWHDLIEYTINEADRLGLEFGMHNSPGWSSSGGPWVTPEMAMQHLSWTETFVEGGKTLSVNLPKPYTNLDHYRDVAVLAFPSLQGEQILRRKLSKLSSNRGPEDPEVFSGSYTGGVDLVPGSSDRQAFLSLEFSEPAEISTMVVESSELASERQDADSFFVETSLNGTDYTRLSDIGAGTWGTGGSKARAARITFPAVMVRFLRVVTTRPRNIANIALSSAHPVRDASVKSNFTHAWSHLSELLESSRDITVPEGHYIRREEVLDITGFMDQNGNLKWDAPAGDWTILRMGHTPVGTRNRSAPSTGSGLEVDKYRSGALDFHFENMFRKLLPMMGPLTSKGGVGLLIDSYEVGMQTWTGAMPEEFLNRRGYDLLTWLPAVTGRYVENAGITDRFLHDFRRTHADLIGEKYYGHFSELCQQHGIISYIEPICRGPMEEFQIASRVSIPMGEFWVGLHLLYPYNIEHRRSLKLAASATHVHGSKIVGAEAFTAEPHAGRWQQHPYGMKAMGDYYFTEGVNRFIFHRFAHQPQHPDVVPGMTMGHWGTHFDRTNTWWSRGGEWLKYISRCQYMLQQGLFVADILYHTGDLVPKYTDIAREDLSLFPPEGYDYDIINTESFLERVTIRRGLISLPDGMTYRLFVLSKSTCMTLEMARRLHELVRGGMILAGARPDSTPGLTELADEAEFHEIVRQIWGDLDGVNVTARTFGRGKVFWGLQLEDILEELDIKPDFEHTSLSGDAPAHFIHRKADDADFYLVTNPRRTPEQLVCTFRVDNRKPEFWDPDTGKISACIIYETSEGRVRMPVRLQPCGSVFVIFRSPSSRRATAIFKDDNPVLDTVPYKIPPAGKFPNVYNNFTISLWVKPEIEIGLGSAILGSYKGRTRTDYHLFYPGEGEAAYGRNHASCSMTVGRNGVVVWERSSGDPVDVLIAETPVSGWTHVSLVYNGGRPSLYLNGRFIKEAAGSGKIVHPGPGDYIPHDGLQYYYYNGGMTEPLVHERVLTADQILTLSRERIPDPPAPADVELLMERDEEIMIWENGDYRVQYNNGNTETINVTGAGLLQDISGGWQVEFPAGTGAPPLIDMPQLVAFNRHPDEGVKYFSGTASYFRQFYLSEEDVSQKKEIFLDLGRVEIIAEVFVNGNNCGILWKPPFRTGLTSFLKAGLNELEIKVTTLWPNRLIGDEQLPAEHLYGWSDPLTGGIRELPSWFMEGKPRPAGKRVAFSTWKHYHKDSPLVESGMLGPVVLRSAVRKKL